MDQYSGARPDSVRILDIPVSRLDMARAVDTIAQWIARGESRHVSTVDVHGVMRAQSEPSLKAAYQAADMVTPDGKPLVWTARLRGFSDIDRVAGPDLVLAVAERSVREGWRHFFYGGAEGVAEALAERLRRDYPGIEIAGTECPPFRSLTEEEVAATLKRIEAAGTDILWVGLGIPKQDVWMHQNAHRLNGVVSVGIGAAFDFHTGRIRRAPLWMQRGGLEWLHRLASEPRRLWRRYLVMAPRFVFASMAETFALRRASGHGTPAE
ncbi:MAG: WecB/TagA/CpsF family glycosyltransferase [Hyphomicrobiaceae bacterium]